MKEANFKETEIGKIPVDWEIKSIGDSFIFKNGLNKEKKFFGYGFPIVNYMDVYRNSGICNQDIQGKVFLNSTELKSFEVKKGDVLFTRTSETPEEIGLSAVILDEVFKTTFSGFLLRARPINELFDLNFCKYCFDNNAVRIQIKSKSTYTTRALTNGRVLSNIQIPLPPLSEQEIIAEVLSDTDFWIESTEALLAKKRQIKKGAMLKLLSPKEDWEVAELKNVAWFQEGPGLRNWQFTDSGMKVINVTNLENGYLNLSRTKRYISLQEFDRMYKHFEIQENDIVVASSGNSYGKIAVVREKDLPLVMNTSVIRFKPLEKIDYNFLLVFLKSVSFKDQIDLLTTGGAQPNFGPAHLNKILVNLPPKNEQKNIADVILSMDLEIESLENRLQKARQLKQGMMQDLLTGKVRLIEN